MPCATASPPRPSLPALEDAKDYQAFEVAVTADYDAEIGGRARTGASIGKRPVAAAPSNRHRDGPYSSWRSGNPAISNSTIRARPSSRQPISRNKINYIWWQHSSLTRRLETELSFDTKNGYQGLLLALGRTSDFALDRLSRYEHLLWRQARQIVFTLESLRRRKRQPSRSSFPFSFRRREPDAVSEEIR